jgi:hypothetical protein
VTTYYDNSRTPVRQSIGGALTHTISSAWHSLSSNGPAPVHIALTTGHMVDTGKEFAFHVPGDGIVLGQDGRLTLAADGSQLSFAGNSVLNATALCVALAPDRLRPQDVTGNERLGADGPEGPQGLDDKAPRQSCAQGSRGTSAIGPRSAAARAESSGSRLGASATGDQGRP